MLSRIGPDLLGEELECVDKVITRVFNCVMKKVEGMRRGVSYTKEKVRVWDTILYWKAYIWQRKGIKVDKKVMEWRKTLHSIDTYEEESVGIAT